MAVSRILGISPVLLNVVKAISPVIRVCLVILLYSPHRAGILTVLRNIGKCFLNDRRDICLLERTGDAARHKDAAVNTIPIMCHTRSFFREAGCLIRVAGRDKSPGIDENLPADLFGNSRSVLGNAAAARRRYSAPQIEVRGVLRRSAIAAPPEKAVLKRRIIQQGIPHIAGREITLRVFILQRPEEKERSVAVVIRGKIAVVHRIIM